MSRIDSAIEKISKIRQQGAGTQGSSQGTSVYPSSAPDMGELLNTPPMRVDNPLLVAYHRNNPRACEEYGKLKTVLRRVTSAEKFRNAIVVTSALRGEGKTLTAVNLAITLAQEYDHTVLLVDADLRRPSIHSFLGMKAGLGLADCLRGKADIEECLVKTGIGKLVVMPGGTPVADPVELLSSKRMKSILEELKNRYPDRYVIFDAPPAHDFADAQVLGTAADGVLFVVREGVAKQAQVKEALSHLRECEIFGVVYNDSEETSGGKRAYLY